MIRQLLLKASENEWLRRHATSSRLLRRSVRRFLPGEGLDDAFAACGELAKANVASVLTFLGESVVDRQKSVLVTNHYVEVLKRIEACSIPIEVSVKLTQLGLDLETEFCFGNLLKLLHQNARRSTLWIDMEQSSYVERTLELYRRARAMVPNVGVCVQAYLRRTEKDIDNLTAFGATVRLVKGAYAEPVEVAFARKSEVDENYLRLATKLLSKEARSRNVRAAFATHDRALVERITAWALGEGIQRSQLEFQMLYGIQREQQRELARRGYRCRVLISYGNSWFPWYMRRLAERPANLMFVLRNLFAS